MIESPPEEPVQDKLLIFVSSRLAECREERKIVRDAIVSINHQPVLFEHLGARAYSARTLYLSRLRSSQVMVAIYRSGYGYIDIANGMTISGLEDEYRFSQRHGIDVLCYVQRSPVNRDVRLVRIIEEMQQRQTLWYYDDPTELEVRVRDDLTAHITNRVLRAGATRDVLRETSANYLQRTEYRVGIIAPRTETLNRLEQAALATQILCLYGPSGIGKTTLAAQLAERIGAIYVRVTGLAPRDIFSVCATALNQQTLQASQTYSTLEGARLGLAASWAEAKSTTLIVDECDFSDELISALSLTDNEAANRHIVITARTALLGTTPFEVPPLTRAEAEELVTQSRVSIDDAVLNSGSPLAIYTAILNAEGALVTAEQISRSTGVSGELLRYLALSEVPLSSDQLLRLRADPNYSVEYLYTDLRSLGPIIDDSPRGLRLMHADTAAAVISELQATPQRLSFYVQRLIRLFEDAGDLLLVYRLASLLNDGTEARYAPATAWQAARLGDWRTAVRITDQMLNLALGDERRAEAFQLMLSLVYPLELMGEAGTATTLIERAEAFAQTLGEEARRDLEEAKICSRARRGLSATDLASLQALYQDYERHGSQWDQGRIGLELSVLYMASKEYEKARELLEITRSLFEDVGDEYGFDLTERNLASALVNLDGYELEADRLIKKIQDRAADEPDARRQRAWLCNILTSRLRRAGRLDEAEALAKEAIEIGDALGDESLRSINLINIGNVYRDKKNPGMAIKSYEEAGIAAQKCGRHDVEADSSRLIAGILNDFDNILGISDRRLRARSHAEHAIGLLRGTVYHESLARSFVELADACEGQNDQSCAVKGYFQAAVEFAAIPDEIGLERALLHGSYIAFPDHTVDYLEGINSVFPFSPPPRSTLPDRFMTSARAILESAPRGALIPLLGRHLQQVWSNIPGVLHPAIVSAVTDLLREFAKGRTNADDQWRILYGGIVVASLLKEGSSAYLSARLASSVALYTKDVFVREEGDGTRIWTVVLSLSRRVTISISTLDSTDDSNVATFALAMFIKAFEAELSRELVANVQADELSIQIARLDQVPTDLREYANKTMDMDRIVADQTCAATRAVSYESALPIFVFLSASFLDGFAFGEGRGGSLQALFGFTLIELTHQLLLGQIDEEEIRPKVISLVRETLS